MAYEGTAQAKIIELMALKMKATMAVQGSFSAEGLASMSKGIDAKMVLAEALMKNSNYKSGESLQDMFDVLNNNENDGKVTKNTARGNYIFSELIGDEATTLKEVQHEMSGSLFDVDGINNLFELFSHGPMLGKSTASKNASVQEKKEKEEKKESVKEGSQQKAAEEVIISSLGDFTYSTITVKKGKRTVDTGQLSLF